MKKYSPEITKKIYEFSKSIYEGRLDVHVCQKIIFDSYGISERSFSGWFVPLFRYMREGITFKGSAPLCLKEYYLERIYCDFGAEGLRNALKSYRGTIDYYENERGENKPGDVKIYENYMRILNKAKA